MRMTGDWRGQRLRERPPRWPRRDEDFEPVQRRWEREREVFEDNAVPELYPGSLVMEDLGPMLDEAEALRVLARYTATRAVLLAMEPTATRVELRVERRVALEHLALLPAHDWERRALERLVRLCRTSPRPAIVDAIIVAAEAAAKRAQPMGSFTLYRAAYELGLAREWWSGAAQAAWGIGRLARLEEARYSIRLWERRAAVLDRRAAAREAAAAADAAREAPAAAPDGAEGADPDRTAADPSA